MTDYVKDGAGIELFTGARGGVDASTRKLLMAYNLLAMTQILIKIRVEV
jgi:hypothetical protein